MNMILHKMKIAGIALIGVSGFFLAEGSMFTGPILSASFLSRLDPIQITLFVLTFCLYYKTRMGPILLTLLAGVASALIGLV